MTGYGYLERASDRYSISLEVKSFNNRYLDIQVNLPSLYGPLEPRIRERISASVERGRVEVSCRIRELEENLKVTVDGKNARVYADALRSLAEAAGLEPDVHLGHLLSMDGILRLERSRDVEDIWPELSRVLEEVMKTFEETRAEEGHRTEGYIREQLDGIERGFSLIRKNADRLEVLLLEHLKVRFDEIVGKSVDESRIAAETAILLMKYSIGEEIERFDGHIGAFTALLDQDTGVSKKLDFISQELNREINTIASKSFLLEVNQAVVGIKDGIEKIREQLRNVE